MEIITTMKKLLHSTEERVVDIIDKPHSSQKSGVTKELSYPSLNMRIIFEQKYAYYIVVSNNLSN